MTGMALVFKLRRGCALPAACEEGCRANTCRSHALHQTASDATKWHWSLSLGITQDPQNRTHHAANCQCLKLSAQAAKQAA